MKTFLLLAALPTVATCTDASAPDAPFVRDVFARINTRAITESRVP